MHRLPSCLSRICISVDEEGRGISARVLLVDFLGTDPLTREYVERVEGRRTGAKRDAYTSSYRTGRNVSGGAGETRGVGQSSVADAAVRDVEVLRSATSSGSTASRPRETARSRPSADRFPRWLCGYCTAAVYWYLPGRPPHGTYSALPIDTSPEARCPPHPPSPRTHRSLSRLIPPRQLTHPRTKRTPLPP